MQFLNYLKLKPNTFFGSTKATFRKSSRKKQYLYFPFIHSLNIWTFSRPRRKAAPKFFAEDYEESSNVSNYFEDEDFQEEFKQEIPEEEEDFEAENYYEDDFSLALEDGTAAEQDYEEEEEEGVSLRT